jgi:hypothetical protein
MDCPINFEFEGQLYTVDASAYDLNRIILPDKRILEADRWLESLPPVPEGLHEVPHVFMEMEPEKIAMLMNGVAARSVSIFTGE